MAEFPVWTHPCVWDVADAVRSGLYRRDVERELRAGRWQRLHRGVYMLGDAVPDPRQRGLAALHAAGEPAVLGFRSAARWYGFTLIDDDDPLSLDPDAHLDEVIAGPAGRRRRTDRLVVHRHQLASGDVVPDGSVSVTSPVRTLLDLARALELPAAVCAWESALRRHQVNRDELLTAVAEQGGRWKVRTLRRVAALVDVTAESPLETLVRLPLVYAGLVPQSQLVVVDSTGGFVARTDLGFGQARVAVEADGSGVHGAPAAVFADRTRQNALQAAGWVVLRFTWYDARRRPGYILSVVRAALAARGA